MVTELDAESQEIVKEELGDTGKAAVVDTGKTKEETIPKERVDQLLAEKQQLKTQVEVLQNQFDLLKANLPQPKTEQPKQPNLMDGIMSPDDQVVEPKHLTEAMNRLVNYINGLGNQVQALFQQTRHTDIQDVLSNNLPNVMKLNPEVTTYLTEVNKVNPAVARGLAYLIGQLDPAYQKKQSEQKTTQDESAKRMTEIAELLKNQKTPLSVAATGSGGGASASTESQLLNDLINLGDDQEAFADYAEKVKSGAVKLKT